MNPNYDMTKLRSGLKDAMTRLAQLGEHREAKEAEEALHVLATQAAWIAKARPVLYHLGTFLETSDCRLDEEIRDTMNETGRLLDGWLPPPTRQVSFDGQNWIDLPYNQNVPNGMQSREKK